MAGGDRGHGTSPGLVVHGALGLGSQARRVGEVEGDTARLTRGSREAAEGGARRWCGGGDVRQRRGGSSGVVWGPGDVGWRRRHPAKGGVRLSRCGAAVFGSASERASGGGDFGSNPAGDDASCDGLGWGSKQGSWCNYLWVGDRGLLGSHVEDSAAKSTWAAARVMVWRRLGLERGWASARRRREGEERRAGPCTLGWLRPTREKRGERRLGSWAGKERKEREGGWAEGKGTQPSGQAEGLTFSFFFLYSYSFSN